MCLLLDGKDLQGLSAALSEGGVPHVHFSSRGDQSAKDMLFRAAAEGVCTCIFVILQSLGLGDATVQFSLFIRCYDTCGHFRLVRMLVPPTLPALRVDPFCIASFSFRRVHLKVPVLNRGSLCPARRLFLMWASCAFVSSAEDTVPLLSTCRCFCNSFARRCACRDYRVFKAGAHFQFKKHGLAFRSKGLTAPPTPGSTGGGLHSQPDWSRPARPQADVLKSIRDELAAFCSSRCTLSKLRTQHQEASDPLFDTAEISEIRDVATKWFSSMGMPNVDWSIPEGQPYCLHAQSSLSAFLGDADSTLFGCLLQGVPTGVKRDIPASGCFAPSDKDVVDEALQVCTENWTGAEADPLLLEELVQSKSTQVGCIQSPPWNPWKRRVHYGHYGRRSQSANLTSCIQLAEIPDWWLIAQFAVQIRLFTFRSVHLFQHFSPLLHRGPCAACGRWWQPFPLT